MRTAAAEIGLDFEEERSFEASVDKSAEEESTVDVVDMKD